MKIFHTDIFARQVSATYGRYKTCRPITVLLYMFVREHTRGIFEIPSAKRQTTRPQMASIKRIYWKRQLLQRIVRYSTSGFSNREQEAAYLSEELLVSLSHGIGNVCPSAAVQMAE